MLLFSFSSLKKRDTNTHIKQESLISEFTSALSAAATKPLMQPVTVSPGATKNNTKADDGGTAKESRPSSDQLVPDYAAGLVISSPFIFLHR